MVTDKTLTAKQERFIQEFLIDLNATQAAVRAGYSEKTAQRIGSENLSKPVIAKRLSEAQAARAKTRGWDAQRVLNRLAEIDDMDAADILDETGNVLAVKEWPKVWRKTISGMDVVEMMSQGEMIGLIKKIKWPDKLRNLELLGKHVDIRAFGEKQDSDGAQERDEQLIGILSKLSEQLPN